MGKRQQDETSSAAMSHVHDIKEFKEDISWKPMDDAISDHPECHQYLHKRSKGGSEPLVIVHRPSDPRDPSDGAIVAIGYIDGSILIHSDSMWTIELGIRSTSILEASGIVLSCQYLDLSIRSHDP